MKKLEKLKKEYEDCCNEYVRAFAKKQGLKFEGWISGNTGGVAIFDYPVGRCLVNFPDIVYDINSNQPKGLIIKWLKYVMSSPCSDSNYFIYANYRETEPTKTVTR